MNRSNPSSVVVSNGSPVAIVVPAVCARITVRQPGGSSRLHAFQPYLPDGITARGPIQPAGSTYQFEAPPCRLWAAGQIIGCLALPSGDLGLATFEIYADPIPPGMSGFPPPVDWGSN